MSLNTGECSARIPLKTRNSTSRATRMMFPSLYQNSSSRFLAAAGSVSPGVLAVALTEPVRARFRVLPTGSDIAAGAGVLRLGRNKPSILHTGAGTHLHDFGLVRFDGLKAGGHEPENFKFDEEKKQRRQRAVSHARVAKSRALTNASRCKFPLKAPVCRVQSRRAASCLQKYRGRADVLERETILLMEGRWPWAATRRVQNRRRGQVR